LANVFGNSSEEDLIFQSIEISQAILKQSPNMIQSLEQDKLYLKEDRVCSMDNGTFLLLDNDQTFYLPHGYVLFNHHGYFLPNSYEILAKKPFKNVCLDCKHEWEGGVFTYRCPKCHSNRIINVPS
jgi:hypothetical protein